METVGNKLKYIDVTIRSLQISIFTPTLPPNKTSGGSGWRDPLTETFLFVKRAAKLSDDAWCQVKMNHAVSKAA